MRKLFGSLLALFLTWTAPVATAQNDAGCDVALLPSATLLLPYFEVDLDDPGAASTLFTITNVTNADAIARVTLWTDRGYPVFTFNLQLTGYDVYPLNLYDVIGRGVIAPRTDARGAFSDPNPQLSGCEAPAGTLDAGVVARLQSALTTGSIAGECEHAGGEHARAIGYATVDVVGNCSANTPRDRAYWRTDLRHDNILLGDYQQIEGAGAQGGPLVHIRAFEDGGLEPAGHRTFYARYTDRDRRQPLPSQFAARWTEGTSLKIWREGRTGLDATCDDYAGDGNMAVADVVAFDDQENAVESRRIRLGPATRTAADDPLLPQIEGTNGWLYLNLDRSARDDFGSQAWVISSHPGGDVDAIALANGCAAPAEDGAKIAPVASDDDSCDIALLPAATLLLPYFEVDLEDPAGERTVFTVTNASSQDRIARVTLWTDLSYPVLTFNVYLTGYDVQTVDLYDVIQRGRIAGDEVQERGPLSDRNFDLDLSGCRQRPARLAADELQRMQLAFIEGIVPALGALPACNNVGLEHENAIGYATIDVVRNCEERSPVESEYWTADIAWDNVLIGDSRRSNGELVQTSPLVHVRATADPDFPRTFYGSYTPAGAPRLDRRQPLPTVFAARWISSGDAVTTALQIWREGPRGRDATCATQDDNAQEWPEVVTFDENENAVGETPSNLASPILIIYELPATARVDTRDSSTIPQLPNGAPGGWIYINLDNDETPEGRAMQAWVVSSMRAGGYTVEMDAAALGNGCSAEVPYTEVTRGTGVIGPLP